MRSSRLSIGVLCVAAAVASTAVATRAQSGPGLPERLNGVPSGFEVATIRQSEAPPNAGALLNFPSPGRLSVTNFSLRMLLGSAFGPELGQGYQIAGGPEWMGQDRYVVLGQAPAGTSRADMFSMLKTLLIERFALKSHVESKEVDAYALVTARSDGKLGAKLLKWDGTCNGKPAPPAQPNATGPRCAAFFRPPGMFMRGVTMTVVANMLSAQITNLGRPVVDKTGLSGEFDFDLETTFAPAAANAGAADTSAPSVFVALQEQLGLKLEPTRTTVKVLVVDAASRPTEN